jgi:hypothetical protein
MSGTEASQDIWSTGSKILWTRNLGIPIQPIGHINVQCWDRNKLYLLGMNYNSVDIMSQNPEELIKALK